MTDSTDNPQPGDEFPNVAYVRKFNRVLDGDTGPYAGKPAEYVSPESLANPNFTWALDEQESSAFARAILAGAQEKNERDKAFDAWVDARKASAERDRQQAQERQESRMWAIPEPVPYTELFDQTNIEAQREAFQRDLADLTDVTEPYMNPETGEVRVTSASGAQKGRKPQAFDSIPSGPLMELAEHFGKGAEKYAKVNGLDNWRNGYEWSLSFAALMRHAWTFWNGEDTDPETGSKHMVAVMWHAMVLVEQMNKHPENDDRQDPR